MFIFARPFVAVAAGMGTALLVVLADGLCQCSPTATVAATGPLTYDSGHAAVTCNAAGPCGIVRAGP